MMTKLLCTNLLFLTQFILDQACHGVHSPTRSKSIRGCSTAPSMGRTVVSLITMAHLFGISVDCKF